MSMWYQNRQMFLKKSWRSRPGLNSSFVALHLRSWLEVLYVLMYHHGNDWWGSPTCIPFLWDRNATFNLWIPVDELIFVLISFQTISNYHRYWEWWTKWYVFNLNIINITLLREVRKGGGKKRACKRGGPGLEPGTYRVLDKGPHSPAARHGSCLDKLAFPWCNTMCTVFWR